MNKLYTYFSGGQSLLLSRTRTTHWRAMLMGVMLMIALSNQSIGQFSIAAGGTNYTQNFDGLASAGTWSDNTTLTGWYARTDNTASITTFGLNTGTTTTAGLYAFGVAGTNPLSDKALGYAPSNAYTGSSGSGKGYIGWRLKNNTGAAISSITVTWSGEQWRRDNTVTQSLLLSYQTGTTVTALVGGTWTSTGSSFGSPSIIGTATALDGNNSANRVSGISVTITVSIAAGDEIMLRWEDLNDAGNDHFLAIDDVTINAALAGPTAPVVTVSAPTSVATTTATFNGGITSIGTGGSATAITTRGFEYGTSATLAGATTASASGSFSTGAYTQAITGLVPNTLYYYRSFATNNDAPALTGYSATSGYPSFTTLHNAPTIGSGSGATSSSITCNWSAPAGPAGAAAFTYTLEVDDDPLFGSVNFTQSAIISSTTFVTANTGLSAGVTYYYRVRAVNAAGNSAWSSTSVGYPTLATVPTVTTATVSSITSTSAGGGGNVTATGGAAVTDRGVVYGPTSPPSVFGVGTVTFSSGTGTGIFTGTAVGLSPQTLYYYRAFAFNMMGYGYGATQSFRTLSAPATTPAANLIANASASNQVDLSWDAASWPVSGATVKGYILVRNVGSAPTLNIQNGVAPASIITTGTLISSTIGEGITNFSNTGLSQLTNYYYTLIPFTWDGTNEATRNYSTPLTANATTPLGPCSPPLTQATLATVVSATAGTLNISWTLGSGDRSLVIVRQGAAVSAVPATGTAYTANAAFSTGDNLGSGNFVCYNGTANNFVLTNLTAATTYYISVYTYNVSGYCFNLTSPATTSGSTSLPASIIETFEPATKGSYTVGTTTGVLGVWTFDDALIGSIAGQDRFNGTRSARIQSTGSITSQFNKTSGLGLVQVNHALFGTDASTTWRLDVSDDGGATFTAYQSPVQTTSSTTLTATNFTVNIPGDFIRVRIVKLSGSTSSRLSIDDISLSDYVSTNTITTGAISGSPFCVTGSAGASVSVPFTSSGVFNTGNVYTAQLSDETGSFASPINIGTLSSVATSGTIVASIPAGTAEGAAYRIRVVSSDPAVTGATSASVLTVHLNTPDISNLYANTANNTVNLGWTNPAGCFDEIMIVAGTAAISCVPSGNGSAYTANATYGSGSSCSGSFVVYKGTAASMSVTGLTNGSTYYFKVFTRKGTNWSPGVTITAVPNDFIVGDYRSHVGTHNYTDTDAWQIYAGAGVWNNTTSYPNGATINVYIVNSSIIELSTSMSTSPIRNLTVEAGGILRGVVGGTSNTYLTVYGDIICNGTIGNGSTWNSISFNMEGATPTISGPVTGAFNASRIRKNYTVNTSTSLIIAKDLNLRWNSSSGTALYNNASNTTFNVTINAGTTVSVIIDPTAPAGASGNACIDGVSGVDLAEKGGTFTVNGTLNVPGILYATTNNTTQACKWVIGATGVINCNQVNCNASGTAGHTLQILPGGLLNVTTTVGFSPTNFSTTNNTYDLQPGSTVEYSAASGITSILTNLTYSNLTFSGGGTRDFIDNTSATTGLTLTVNKNLTITGTTTLDPVANAIQVGGNWVNYGSIGFAEGTSNVTFNGFSGAQKIICSGGEVFYNMLVTNNTASGVEMNTDVEVKNDLTLGGTGRLFFGATPVVLRLSKMAAASNSLIGTPGSLLDMSGAAHTMFVGCENLNYTGTFTAGTTSLVNYNRDASVSGSGGSGNQNIYTNFTYANLSFSGSNTKNTSDHFTVTGTLTVDGATTSLEATTAGKTLTLGGDIILSGGGTMGGATGVSCLSNLSILTSGNTNQTFYGGFESINCYNLSTDKTSNGIILNDGNTTLHVSNWLTQSTAATLTPGSNRVKIGGGWTVWGGAGFVRGTSTVEYNGAASETIIALDYYNLESSNTGARVMANSGTVGVENTFTKGTNSYTFTGSTVNYFGAGAQNIAAFTAGASTGATYNNLTLSTSGTKSLTGHTDVEGALSLNNSITFAVGNFYLNLKSTVAQTARVAPVSASAAITYGSGKFVVERYYPGRRSWRMITAPVTVDASKTFFNSWQVGGNTSLAGSGTYITGPNPLPATNGLDVSPQNNSSLKTFNQTTSAWDAVTNTKTLRISGTAGAAGTPDNVGYFMFVRGDRTSSNVNAFTPLAIVNETTLRDTGFIQVQNYTFAANPNTGTHKYTVIGNPYASPVDFDLLSFNNVAKKFQAWDPGLNVVGGYVVVDFSIPGPPTITPLAPGVTTQTQIIQSSQAVVVETTGASSPSVSFSESAKSATNNLTLFRGVRPANIASIAANLYTLDSAGTPVLADGVQLQLSEQFSNAIDQLDAAKFTNIHENFSIFSNNSTYMLERRKMFTDADTLFFRMSRTTARPYKLKFITERISRNNLTAWLIDSYSGNETPVSLEGDTWVDFEVNADAASKASNRFYVVFKKRVRFAKFDAAPVKGNVFANWQMIGDKTSVYYELERSVNGTDYTKLYRVNRGTNNPDYQYTDEHPAPGDYYYRVKSVDRAGNAVYSDAKKVVITSSHAPMYVYPNPVTNSKVQVHFTDQKAGNYTLRLMDAAGLQVSVRQVIHAGGTSDYVLEVPGGVLSPGVYQLTAELEGKRVALLQVLAGK